MVATIAFALSLSTQELEFACEVGGASAGLDSSANDVDGKFFLHLRWKNEMEEK